MKTGCECSESWKGFKPAPIEVFHGEALKEFHAGSKFPAQETIVDGVRFINGNRFNTILAAFKVKVQKEYGISSDAIKIETQEEG